METTLELFVTLLAVSGFYLVLAAACAIIERLSVLELARPRRARTQTGRTQRRSRSARPRRRRDGAEDLAPARRRPLLEVAG